MCDMSAVRSASWMSPLAPVLTRPGEALTREERATKKQAEQDAKQRAKAARKAAPRKPRAKRVARAAPPCAEPASPWAKGGRKRKVRAAAPPPREALPRLPDPWKLSQREYSVFERHARGLSVAAIAAELCIQRSTVTTMVWRVRLKMGAHTTSEAVLLWHRQFRNPAGDKPIVFDRDDTLIAHLRAAVTAPPTF